MNTGIFQRKYGAAALVAISGAVMLYSRMNPMMPEKNSPPTPSLEKSVSRATPQAPAANEPGNGGSQLAQPEPARLKESLARMMWSTPDVIQVEMDYGNSYKDTESGIETLHGFFWLNGNSQKKTQFFLVDDILVSNPDGSVYCDDLPGKALEVFKDSCGQRKILPEPSDLSQDLAVSPYFQLVSGNASDTCLSPKYSGKVTVRGWYAWERSYVEKNWLLTLSPRETTKVFSSGFSRVNPSHFGLSSVDEKTLNRLKKSSSENPVSVTIQGISMYCEGAFTLNMLPYPKGTIISAQ